uniref:REJ domain-containing protein n=1 Tax=Macrostomum lignano TaxID=282301 RepID=A0A1I8HA28_9PLAT
MLHHSISLSSSSSSSRCPSKSRITTSVA